MAWAPRGAWLFFFLCAQWWNRGAEGLGEGFVGSNFAPRSDIWAVFCVTGGFGEPASRFVEFFGQG